MDRLLLTLALVAVTCPGLALAEAYKWVDDEGIVHYGDHVPPEYAENKLDVYEDGVVKEHYEGKLTPEELAMRRAREKQEREAMERDAILLKTYSSVRQIEELRDNRINLLDSQNRITTEYLRSLEQKRTNLEKEVAHYNYPYDKDSRKPPAPEKLLRELLDTVKTIARYQDQLLEVEARKALIDQKFSKDISRYRELTEVSEEEKQDVAALPK